MSTKLNQLSEIARQDPKVKFASLAHLLDEECLERSYRELNLAIAGQLIDRLSYEAYGNNLDENIAELVKRLKTKRYIAQDIRQAKIPKPGGGQRPLGILLLEDRKKLVYSTHPPIGPSGLVPDSFRSMDKRGVDP